MENKLIEKAKELNITQIGFCDAFFDEELLSFLEERRNLFGIIPFEEKDILKRVDPSLFLEGAKSVIVCLFPYKTDNAKSNLSSYAKCLDYHIIAKEKLNELAKCLDGFRFKIGVDTSPLCDRYLAYKAGLGFFGKSTMLINDEYGTYFSIGFIVTDCKLISRKRLERNCKGCNLCIKKCPGNAISDGFKFDFNRCISYISQAKEISPKQIKLLQKGDKVLGCDVCQDICPHNKGVKFSPITEFCKDKIQTLDYDDIKLLSNREFLKKYGRYPFSWLGKNKIKRNFEEKYNLNEKTMEKKKKV